MKYTNYTKINNDIKLIGQFLDWFFNDLITTQGKLKAVFGVIIVILIFFAIIAAIISSVKSVSKFIPKKIKHI